MWDLVGRRECNAREEKRASYITYVGVRKMSKGESEGSHLMEMVEGKEECEEEGEKEECEEEGEKEEREGSI